MVGQDFFLLFLPRKNAISIVQSERNFNFNEKSCLGLSKME